MSLFKKSENQEENKDNYKEKNEKKHSKLKLSSNDISPEKNENTETISTENRINTEGL
jgi:hypothetical protein